MASSCHIGVTDGDFGDGFGDNFMQEGVKSVLVVLILSFSSYLHLGAFSNSFLMTCFTSLVVTLLVCSAASKLNYWDS